MASFSSYSDGILENVPKIIRLVPRTSLTPGDQDVDIQNIFLGFFWMVPWFVLDGSLVCSGFVLDGSLVCSGFVLDGSLVCSGWFLGMF